MWVVAEASDGRCQQSQAQTKPSSGEGPSDCLVPSSPASPSSPAAFESIRQQTLTQWMPHTLGPELGTSPGPAQLLAREERQSGKTDSERAR